MTGRGKPKASHEQKRRDEAVGMLTRSGSQPTLSSILTRSANVEEDTDSEQDFVKDINNSIEKLRNTLLKEIKSLQQDFNQAILDMRQTIDVLTKENDSLKERCDTLEGRVAKLEQQSQQQDILINKQERFSRRNNLRIVGLKSSRDENCLEMAAKVFEEVGVSDCKIERAHRDGKIVTGRDRHLLVKLSFYQDKISVLRNARKALASKPYYIVDDLTQTDLKEKTKWRSQVQELFENGTKLRFSGGCWRDITGKPFKFRMDA